MNAGETPYNSKGPYIFISYSRRDRERVSAVLDALRKQGYRIWYDGIIPAGEPWPKSLAEHISGCAVFLPLLSADFLKSENCLQEVRFVDPQKQNIVPVLLETLDRNAIPAEMKFLLNKRQELKLTDFPDADAFAAHLQHEPHMCDCREAEAVSNLVLVTERPMSPTPYFVGRDEILDAIEAAFRDGDDIVNVYGMGGIGKSEICRKFFRDRAPGLVTRVGWLTWRDTLQNTLYAQFPDIREDNAARYLNLARAYVNDTGRDLLLVVDNADTLTPDDVRELSQLQCRLLVTSRRRQGRFQHIPAATLPPEQCRILYRRALLRDDTISDASPDDDALTEILRLAAWHTLTVELLAKTQRAAGLDTAELLQELRDTGFDLSGEDIEYLHNPETASKDIDPECPFIEHMSRIFDLSQLREPRKDTFLQKIFGFFQKRETVSEALRVLQGMSLLSPNTPIPVNTVKAWLDLPNLNGVNKAVDTGWLDEKIELDGARSVSIHPVIAAVVRHTEPPEAEYVDAVAGRLAQDIIVGTTEVFTMKLPILKHAIALHRVAKSMDLQTENYGRMLHQIGYLMKQQGYSPSALEWFQKALHINKKVLGIDHLDTATTYNNIGEVYREQGDYASALKFLKKASPIFEAICGTDHPRTLMTYNNLSKVYRERGDYTSALEWSQKTLHVCESILSIDPLSKATTYNNIALIYKAQGDYNSALEWYQKALCIREHVLSTDHPDTATTYNNIGEVYRAQGDYASALEWHQKALRIRERVLGTEHPSTATTYHNIAGVYWAQGDHASALEWLKKALRIQERVLGTEHPDTAATYNGIAGVYWARGDYASALEWYQKALRIRERVLGTEHPDTAYTYHNIGTNYFRQGDFREALKWLKKALAIRLRVLGAKHPSTKITQGWIDAAQRKLSGEGENAP